MINTFKGEHAFLSNFYILTYPIHWRGINYKSSEHFYQAMKTLNFHERLTIANCQTAGETKKLGRKVTLREDWKDIPSSNINDIKDLVMRTALTLKFSINDELAYQLLSTGDQTLTEGNYWHDNYWGNCTCPKCTNKPGKNQLGLTLMYVRKTLKLVG